MTDRRTGATPCGCTRTSCSPRCSSPSWPRRLEAFTDYLYLSFTNAISFAASDVTR